MLVDKPLKLFSLNANIPLAKQVAKAIRAAVDAGPSTQLTEIRARRV